MAFVKTSYCIYRRNSFPEVGKRPNWDKSRKLKELICNICNSQQEMYNIEYRHSDSTSRFLSAFWVEIATQKYIRWDLISTRIDFRTKFQKFFFLLNFSPKAKVIYLEARVYFWWDNSRQKLSNIILDFVKKKTLRIKCTFNEHLRNNLLNFQHKRCFWKHVKFNSCRSARKLRLKILQELYWFLFLFNMVSARVEWKKWINKTKCQLFWCAV